MDLYSKTVNMVVSPLKDISDSVNSTISSSAERTWQLVKRTGGSSSPQSEAVSTETAPATGIQGSATDMPTESQGEDYPSSTDAVSSAQQRNEEITRLDTR